ncbi:NIPSNAP family protein [Pendulispora rubella]|uniref:NIPSNAP family protein n=1 Tax=Pendulispora rubella TaxID=2741070 RepID=A0ABZ2L1G0_9BACT
MTEQEATVVLEIRTYRLRSGRGERFHQIFREQAVPLLRRYGITVVDFGPSLINEADEPGEGYFLMRAFPSLERREALEGAFYGSDEWRKGPRPEVLSLIENYHTTVITVPSAAVQALIR